MTRDSDHTVVLPGYLRHHMIEHALRELPNECCGVVLGRNRRFERAVAMRSTPPAPDAYFMDPLQQAAVFTDMEQRGEELLGIYHSHPTGPPTPSGMDLQLAFHPQAVYFVISLESVSESLIKGFMVDSGSWREIALLTPESSLL